MAKKEKKDKKVKSKGRLSSSKKKSKSKAKPSGSKGENNKTHQSQGQRPKTQLQYQKEFKHLFSFGSVVNEFFKLNTIGKQKVEFTFDSEQDTYTCNFTFAEPFKASDGNQIGYKAMQCMSDVEWMKSRNKFKSSPGQKKFYGLLLKLDERLGIHIDVDIRVVTQFNKAERLITSHLSPVESAILMLSETQWNSRDTTKLANVLKDELMTLTAHYGNLDVRPKVLKSALEGVQEGYRPAKVWATSATVQEVFKMIKKDETYAEGIQEMMALAHGHSEEGLGIE